MLLKNNWLCKLPTGAFCGTGPPYRVYTQSDVIATPQKSFSIKKIFVWPFPKLYTDWDQKLHSCKILLSCKRRRDLVKSWLVMMYSISCFLWPLSEGSVPDGDVAGIRLHTISTWIILTHRIGLAHTPSPFHLRVENHSLFFCWWIITIGLVKL